MNKLKQLEIHCSVLPNGDFFLYATKDGYAVSNDEWVPLFFQWHKESYFGNMVEKADTKSLKQTGKMIFDGVILDCFQGLSLFATEPFNSFVQWEFDECSQTMLSIAPLIYEKIIQKQWNIEFASHEEGLSVTFKIPDDVWDEFVPSFWDEDISDFWLSSHGNENVPKRMRTFVTFLFQHGIDRYLKGHGKKYEMALQRKQLLNHPSFAQLPLQTFFDGKRFLQWIGLTEDEKPFSIGLRLEEPHEEGEWWKLEVVLTDKKNRDRMLSYSHPLKGRRISKTWKAFFQEVDEEISRIGELFPWLKKEQNDEISDKKPVLKAELTEDEAWEFLTNTSEILLQLDIDIFLPAWWEALKKATPSLKARVKSSVKGPALIGMDTLMNFEWRLAMNGVDLSEEQFRRLVNEKRKLIQMNGRWMKLDPAFIKKVQKMMDQAERTGIRLQDLIQQELLYGEGEKEESVGETSMEEDVMKIQFELQPKLRTFIQNISSMTEIPSYPVPKDFCGILRPYQEKGMSWLYFLRQHRFGACLADDMGLGKTIQFIAYLLLVKEREPETKPTLIICPTSVLGNWQRELERFAPKLKIYLHYGPNRLKGKAFKQQLSSAFNGKESLDERNPVHVFDDSTFVKKGEIDRNHLKDHEQNPLIGTELMVEDTETSHLSVDKSFQSNVDVVLTTYGLAHLDFEELTDIHWGTIVLDEAQNIKNAETKQSRAIRKLQGDHHIALTGTPMENRLSELWSIFDFINKGYLGSLSQFQKQYILPIERDHDQRKIEELRRLIRPFLLRRTKRDQEVELNLPDKLEQKEYCPLTVEQAALYEQLVKDTFEQLNQLTEFERKGLVLRLLGKLKQLCNHPALYLKQTEDLKLEEIIHRSTKLEKLVELADTILDQGERGLIFTQYIGMGQMIQRILEQKYKIAVPFLNGSMPKQKRDELISAFQKGEYPFLLLSLKAGGTGLNLTAANHVIHYDRWWNPAVENQATDRAYRIGQKKFVHVHKMITTGTLEEKIDQMLEKKQALNDEIIQSDKWITDMKNDELYDLLRLEK
ncbi:DEAD/DEAH box helicase [Fervidibacillus halotolerans]|uniref:DEAD/DEAH box helicase n=1 Tax=Fervidibacillus halotolerans TaxID=2980027 RepID=A0A9E8M0M8_9BACI|nr:DEAD/DEAH box helicase [Fervidibacillus halotolerans]WAA12144.1 DEAD/DEAH box helicase [Fervidibacillus halotolerans]